MMAFSSGLSVPTMSTHPSDQQQGERGQFKERERERGEREKDRLKPKPPKASRVPLGPGAEQGGETPDWIGGGRGFW